MTFPTKLERLLKEATEGPWRVYDDSNDGKTNRMEIVAIGKTVAHIYQSVTDYDLPNAELIVLLRNHADAILGLVRAAERSMEHAAHKREADKEPDDLMRAGILGGMVISIEEELRPAMEALNRASDLSR